MDTQKALEITKSLKILANALDMTIEDLGGCVCFFDEKRIDVLNEAIAKTNKFFSMSLTERGKVFGITITENKRQ